jgi:hypothetical protein
MGGMRREILLCILVRGSRMGNGKLGFERVGRDGRLRIIGLVGGQLSAHRSKF